MTITLKKVEELKIMELPKKKVKHYNNLSISDEDFSWNEGYNQAKEEYDDIELDLSQLQCKEKVSIAIQNIKHVGMTKHFHIGKEWADEIATALVEGINDMVKEK